MEKLADRNATKHVLDEAPKVTWEQIGGQSEAIAAIRKAIEYPLLHAATFQQFKFSQPKGFLLYGPPGLRENAHRSGGGREPVEAGQRVGAGTLPERRRRAHRSPAAPFST